MGNHVRIAIRKSADDTATAYLAVSDDLEGAKVLGTIDTGICQGPVYEAWINVWTVLAKEISSIHGGPGTFEIMEPPGGAA